MSLLNVSITLLAIGGTGAAIWRLPNAPDWIKPVASLIGVASVVIAISSAISAAKDLPESINSVGKVIGGILPHRAPDIAEFDIGSSVGDGLNIQFYGVNGRKWGPYYHRAGTRTTYRLTCVPGETLWFGATSYQRSGSWGAGNGTNACSNCGAVCGGWRFSTNLTM
jgi:hypothetical protein